MAATERRLAYPVPSVPPTSPPTYTALQELKPFDWETQLGDTPFGVTWGSAFPANPPPFARHFLTDEVITEGPLEWFYWNPRINGGAGRWLSERVIAMEFGKTAAVVDNKLDVLGIGVSGDYAGYTSFSRPMVCFATRGTQATSGGDAGMRYVLKTSAGAAEHVAITMGANLIFEQPKRDLIVPVSSSPETFWARVDGTSGLGPHFQVFLRRTEVNP